MSEHHDDVFGRLNSAIDEWNTQISASHRDLSDQIAAAQDHLARLLTPGPAEAFALKPVDPPPDMRADELETLRSQVADRDAELRKCDGIVASLTMEVTALRAAASREEANSQAIEVLRGELAQAQAERDEARGHAAQFASSARNHEAQLHALQADLAQARAAHDEARAGAQSAQASEAQLASLKAAHDRARAELDEARASAEGAMREAADLREQVDALSRALAQSEAGYQAIESELQNALETGAQSAARLIQLQQAGDAAQEQLTAALDAQKSLTTKFVRLEEELLAAQKECARAVADRDAMKAEIARMETVLRTPLVEKAPAPVPAAKPAEAGPPTPPPIDAFAPEGHKKRMGEILVEQGMLTQGQLQGLLDEQSRDPQRRFGKMVVEYGYTTEEMIARILAAQLRLPFLNLESALVETKATLAISAHLARLHRVMPMREEVGKLVMAMANPLDLIAIEDVELASKRRVEPVVATASQIDRALDRYYPRPA